MTRLAFTIANARSGAHMLHGMMADAFDMEDLGEVFTPSGIYDPQVSKYRSFELFLKTRPDLTEVIPFGFPEQVNAALDAFFSEALAQSPKPLALANIKYGHLACLNPVIHDLLGPPYLGQWVRDGGRPVVHLVRRNLLGQHASWIKSLATQEWVDYDANATEPDTQKITLDPSDLVAKLTAAYREAQFVDGLFQGRPNSCLIYYEDLLEDGHLSRNVAQILSMLFGPYTSLPTPKTRKMSPPLEEFVTNYGAVCDVLRGTAFESMLA